MPYPYEPYDPMLTGTRLPAAQPYGGMYGPSGPQQQQQGPAQPSMAQPYDPSTYDSAVPPGTVPGQGMASVPPNPGLGSLSGYAFGDPMEQQRQSIARNALAMALQGNTMDSSGPGGPVPIPEQYLHQAEQLKEMTAPGPMEQNYLNMQANVPGDVHGFKAHLAGIGKGLLMGGLGGAALGGFDPSMVNRAWYRSQLPGPAHAAEAERSSREGAMKRAEGLSQLTGVDPITGLRTPQMVNHDYMNQLAFGRLGQGQERIDVQKDRAQVYREAVASRIDHYKTLDAAAQKAQARADYNSGMLNTPEGLDWAAKQLGVPATLMPKFQAGAIKVGDDFGFVDVRTGEKLGITSSQKTVEAAKQERFNRSEGEKERHDQATESGKGALTDAQIDKQARAKYKLPPFHDPADEGPNEQKIEAEKARLKAERDSQRQTGKGVKVTAPLVGRRVQRTVNGKVQFGTIVGENPDKSSRINWE